MKPWEYSLQRLIEMIPPPAHPKYSSGTLIDRSLPTMPDDFVALIQAYGSGAFMYDNIGCVIELFNPFDPWHRDQANGDHELLRDYRMSEGDEYMPYSVFPEQPGVLICGWNDRRDFWFWHVNDIDSNKWPIVFYGDMQDSYEFKMPLVVFMQKLFFGEISRRDLNFAEPDFQPEGFEFKPTFRTGSPH